MVRSNIGNLVAFLPVKNAGKTVDWKLLLFVLSMTSDDKRFTVLSWNVGNRSGETASKPTVSKKDAIWLTTASLLVANPADIILLQECNNPVYSILIEINDCNYKPVIGTSVPADEKDTEIFYNIKTFERFYKRKPEIPENKSLYKNETITMHGKRFITVSLRHKATGQILLALSYTMVHISISSG